MGKSTVARRISERLGIPHVELDALHHGPNWTHEPVEVFRAKVSQALEGDAWVVDGNYEGKLGDLVLERADLVVWLDLPLRTSLRRLWRRTLDRVRNDVELWSGNRETWRAAFWGRESLFVWAVRSHLHHRRTWPARLGRFRVLRLRSPREVEEWLATL